MEFTLATPETGSPVTGVKLSASVFQFPGGPILIALVETHADGSTTPREITLTDAEVATYFATPVSPAGFRATFAQAFIAAVQGHYPTAQVSG